MGNTNIKKSANIRNYLINVTYITIGCIFLKKHVILDI